jgi:hypothetical protein
MENLALKGRETNWIGYFEYPDRERVIGLFIMTLGIDKKGKVTGRCEEPRTDFGPEAFITLTSSIEEGYYNELLGHIAFDKVYGYDGHLVHYSGMLEGNKTVGKWYIDDYIGNFEMSII